MEKKQFITLLTSKKWSAHTAEALYEADIINNTKH